MLEPKDKTDKAFILEFKVFSAKERERSGRHGSFRTGADRRERIRRGIAGAGDSGRAYPQVWICILREGSADRRGKISRSQENYFEMEMWRDFLWRGSRLLRS